MVFGRRLVTALAASAGLVGVTAAVTPGIVGATPGPSGSTCTLNGSANLKPGLNASSQAFTYSFTGNLTNCQASDTSAPATGTVAAGTVITVGGLQYQLPIPTGTGGCTNSTTSGTEVTTWSDGTLSVVSYTTTGALAAVGLQGTVVPSVVAKQVGGTGQITLTTSPNRYLGDTSVAALTFQPPDPTACNGAGVTVAAISGQVGIGTISTS